MYLIEKKLRLGIRFQSGGRNCEVIRREDDKSMVTAFQCSQLTISSNHFFNIPVLFLYNTQYTSDFDTFMPSIIKNLINLSHNFVLY